MAEQPHEPAYAAVPNEDLTPVERAALSTVVAGKRPDITPAQIVSGVPILAECLHAFGVYDLSQAQQDSLGKMVTWALVLLGSDALIRVGRNLASHFRP